MVIGFTSSFCFKQIADYEKNEDSIRTGQGKEDPFEFLFSKAQAEHALAMTQRNEDDAQDTEVSESGIMVTRGEPVQTFVS